MLRLSRTVAHSLDMVGSLQSLFHACLYDLVGDHVLSVASACVPAAERGGSALLPRPQ